MKFLNYLKKIIKKHKKEPCVYNLKFPYEFDKTYFIMNGKPIKITNVKDKCFGTEENKMIENIIMKNKTEHKSNFYDYYK